VKPGLAKSAKEQRCIMGAALAEWKLSQMSADEARVVYRLRHDTERLEAVQRATRTTRKFGIMKTDGLFGSEAWWRRIDEGQLKVHTVRGIITRLYIGGMRDTPEFVLRSDDGRECSWLRLANSDELEEHYKVGRQIELDYVLQRNRLFSDGFWPKRQRVVIEIRIASPPT
jgi:hypothetical protein